MRALRQYLTTVDCPLCEQGGFTYKIVEEERRGRIIPELYFESQSCECDLDSTRYEKTKGNAEHNWETGEELEEI